MERRRTLDALQLLRAVASMLVVLYHVTENCRQYNDEEFLWGFFAFGGSGVDIFFVLSGFIIAHTSLHQITQRRNFFPFLKKRFVRIYPTYWIIISAFLLVQLLAPTFYRTPYEWAAGNVVSTYLLFPGHTMVNGVSWTLTYELFFYLIFALAFLIRSRRVLLGFLIGYSIILIFACIMELTAIPANPWVELLYFPMNLEFAMGVFIALVAEKLPRQLGWPFIIIGVLSFLTAGVLLNQGYVLYETEFNRVLYFGIPSFFLIWGAVSLELKSLKVKVGKVSLALGDASYSLYLLHLPIVAACAKLFSMSGIQNTYILHISMIVLVIFISYLSILFFKLVEKPIIKKLNAKRMPAPVF